MKQIFGFQMFGVLFSFVFTFVFVFNMTGCPEQWIKCQSLRLRGCAAQCPSNAAHQLPNWQNTSSRENNQSWPKENSCKNLCRTFLYKLFSCPSHPGSNFCLQPAFSVQWIYLNCLAFFCTEFSGGLSKAIQKCRLLPGQKTSAVGRVLNCSKMLLPRPVFLKLRPT